MRGYRFPLEVIAAIASLWVCLLAAWIVWGS